jgi:hypothetical protein
MAPEHSREVLGAGFHDDYQWLTANWELDDVLHLFPQTLLGKYLAVTSFDSGALTLTDELKRDGWQSRGGIAYSSEIRFVDRLPRGGFDEWYVFETPPSDLGQIIAGNIFDASLEQGRVGVFVNYGGFDLSASSSPLLDLFWRQLKSVGPDSYLADSGSHMTFVTRYKELFATVHMTMTEQT